MLPHSLARARESCKPRLIILAAAVALAVSHVLFVACTPSNRRVCVATQPCDPVAEAAWQARLAHRSAARERLGLIEQELAESGTHEWAGIYRSSQGVLGIAPRGRAAYQWTESCGTWHVNMGSIVAVTRETVQLEWQLATNSMTLDDLSSTYHRVNWTGRRYLIAEHRLLGFCNDVNAGLEATCPLADAGWRAGHLVHSEDRHKTVTGLPDVPAEYRDFLLRDAVTARIQRIISKTSAPNRWDLYVAEIDAGSSSGLRPGMKLYPTSSTGWWSATVKSVAADSATLEIGDYEREERSAPHEGAVMCSTR